MNWATGKIILRRIDEEPESLASGGEEDYLYNQCWSQLVKLTSQERYMLGKQRILESNQDGVLTSEDLGLKRVIQTPHRNNLFLRVRLSLFQNDNWASF